MPPSLSTKEPSSKPFEHPDGQHRQQWNVGPEPTPRTNNTLTVANNSTRIGFSSRGNTEPNRVGVKHHERVPNRYASGTRQNGVLVVEHDDEGRGLQNMGQMYRRPPQSQPQGQVMQEGAAPRRQNGQMPQSSGSRVVEDRRMNNGAAHQNLSRQFRGSQHLPMGNSNHSQHHPTSRVTNAYAKMTPSTRAFDNTGSSMKNGSQSMQNGSQRTGGKVTLPSTKPSHGRQHAPQTSFISQSAVSQDARTGGQVVASSHSVVDLSEGEVALRARLAELEKQNAKISARVSELEEHNFDLEASMQVMRRQWPSSNSRAYLSFMTFLSSVA